MFGVNSVTEGRERPEDFKKTQLVWDQLFDKINERLSRLESEFKEEKKQRKEFNSKINNHLSNLTKTMNERIDKVEKQVQSWRQIISQNLLKIRLVY